MFTREKGKGKNRSGNEIKVKIGEIYLIINYRYNQLNTILVESPTKINGT